MSYFAVGISENASSEKAFVIDIVFREMLGIPYYLSKAAEGKYEIRGQAGHIEMPDVFFSESSYQKNRDVAIPALPLPEWEAPPFDSQEDKSFPSIPVLYGSPGLKAGGQYMHCNADIFGSIFFMLSRYEETVLSDRDMHDRFPAKASLAFKSGFLERPIVDEYVAILWAMMKCLWPQLERRQVSGKVFVTCDVDQPFDCIRSSASHLMKAITGDIVKRRDIAKAARRFRDFASYHRGDHERDENYTFDWYMNTCEQYNRQAAFYFIPDHSGGAIDGCYRLTDREILKLIRKLSDRGHEVGVHSSYNTYRSGDQIEKERRQMIAACERAGADPDVRGNRQHYLRWDSGETPEYLDAAGYDYDTTGGFADAPGFRFGTSRSFSMWSWRRMAPLRLKQRPLLAMDTTLFAPHYLGMSYSEEALDLLCDLKEQAIRFGGNFTLLWHNSHLTTPKDREFFEELIR